MIVFRQQQHLTWLKKRNTNFFVMAVFCLQIKGDL